MSHGGNRRSQYREVCKTPFRKVFLERVKGIEPSYAAWEAAVLPLNYTRIPLLYNLPDRAWQSLHAHCHARRIDHQSFDGTLGERTVCSLHPPPRAR